MTRLIFYVTSCIACGITCCYAQFNVLLSIKLSVAVYSELVEESLSKGVLQILVRSELYLANSKVKRCSFLNFAFLLFMSFFLY